MPSTVSIKSRRSRKVRSNKQSIKLPDPILTGIILLLLLIGVLFVYEASVVEAYTLFSDKLHFARLQFIWSGIGLTITAIVAFLPPKLFKTFSFPFFVFTIFLLLLVLIPGIGANIKGASRWLSIGSFSFQPSELAKISLLLYLSALFEKQARLKHFLFVVGILSGLILLQPDLGTTITLSTTAFVVYYLAGAPNLTSVLLALSSGLAAFLLILSSDYRRARLLTFLNPDKDPLGRSYHIRQILISLGSGGFLGTGIGRSLQKYQFLPEPTTDSIFAVIAEETGLIGSSLILFLYIAFAVRGMYVAARIENKFYRLVSSGIIASLILQALLNLGAMVAIVPLTGITLPFISYGRSSLLISLASAGILLNLSRFRQTNVS